MVVLWSSELIPLGTGMSCLRDLGVDVALLLCLASGKAVRLAGQPTEAKSSMSCGEEQRCRRTKVERARLEVKVSVWYADTWVGIKGYQSTRKLARAVQKNQGLVVSVRRSCDQWSQWKCFSRLQHKACAAVNALTKCESVMFIKKW